MKPFEKPIYVTRPFLPPFSEFCKGLREIWENRWLTNYGPVVQRFEKRLQEYMNIENLCLFANGTLALQIAFQGLGITGGEVITTPFTFVATTHALYWNKIRPVFCDIEPQCYTLDPDKVEELITPWTTAILAVHVFGNPCKLEKLQKIARKHNLRLIYDAAHAFGVKVGGDSIAKYGDLSMFSFHATKLFHSVEGGMLTFRDAGLKSTFNYLKNFGFKNELEVVMPGTNAKMSEIHALMGLQILKHVENIIEKGKLLANIYRQCLSEVPGIILMPEFKNIRYNYSYMPVRIVESEFGIDRTQLYDRLKDYNVFTRKYFYPLICDYPCYKSIVIKDSLEHARLISSQILTLPIYPDLTKDDVNRICEIIIKIQRKLL